MVKSLPLEQDSLGSSLSPNPWSNLSLNPQIGVFLLIGITIAPATTLLL